MIFDNSRSILRGRWRYRRAARQPFVSAMSIGFAPVPRGRVRAFVSGWILRLRVEWFRFCWRMQA